MGMKNNKWLRLAVVLMALWLSVCGGLWLGAPVLLQSVLQNQGSEWLGRRIAVERIEVRPWSLEVALHNLQVAHADGRPAQFSLQRLQVNAEVQSLLRWAPVIQSIQVEQPVLHLTHWGNGRYDWDDVVAKWMEPTESTEPARFALYNVQVSGGGVFVQDHQLPGTAQTHNLTDLRVDLPFISNFQAYQTVAVQPRITFKLNNVPFDSQIRSALFAPAPSGALALQIQGLDVSTYTPYWPATLPVRLQRGILDLNAQVDFAQTTEVPTVQLHGRLAASDLQVSDTHGAPLLQLAGLELEMADVRPLERQVELTRLLLDAPVLHLNRTSLPAFKGSKQTPAAIATPNHSPEWRFKLAKLELKNGGLHWKDTTVRPRADLALRDVSVVAENLAWPASNPLQAKGALSVVDESKSVAQRASAARVQWDGSFSLQQALLNLDLQTFDFRLAAPYLASTLEPKLQGTLDGRLELAWQPNQLVLTVPQLALKNVSLHQGASVLPRLQALELRDGMLDLANKQVRIQSLQLTRPSMPLERDAAGQWAWQAWLKPSAPAPTQSQSASSSPWRFSVAQAGVRQGAVTLEDRSTTRPVRLALTQLQFQLQHLRWLGDHFAAGWMPASFSATVQSGRTDPGSIQYQGRIQAHPHWEVDGRYQLKELPLHALYPYVAERWNLDVMRADASAQGRVRAAALPQGMQMDVQTDAMLEDVRVVAASAVQSANNNPLGLSRELLRWKTLHVPGLTLHMEPGRPIRLDVEQVLWSDFYARLVVQSNGRLNLQDLLKPVVQDASASAPEAEPAAEPFVGPVLPAQIALGPIQFERGTVQFTDLFIQPNYSTDLTDLHGALSDLSSLRRADGQVGLAQLTLRGKAEGTAQLDIAGKLNPLVQPIVLDIQAKMDDLELSPLSPYSAKYAGYGIERGKLDVDLQYNIAPDGTLRASNRIVLNQLTFGDKVPQSSASLPVKLAVALLQDSQGVIDVNLPISGSINDPQFRIGPIIVQVIVNLIKKAVTAPFSLLASAFSDGANHNGKIDFAIGSSVVQPGALQTLDKLVQALQKRPGVVVTLTGSADAAREQGGLRRAELHKMMLREHLRRSKVIVGALQPVSAWSPEQYATVLKSVYRRVDMVKPRNLVGIAKDVSVAEMEALLLANISVTDDVVRDLALARSMAVKDYLLSQNIPSQRVFLGAAKVTADEADWTPHVQMGVALP
jgi:uncharacterized protein involved in outer membrane biogenesis